MSSNDKGAKSPQFLTSVETEIRGDQILVSARKFNKPKLIRRTGNHQATEMVVEKDARARLLRAYTSASR